MLPIVGQQIVLILTLKVIRKTLHHIILHVTAHFIGGIKREAFFQQTLIPRPSLRGLSFLIRGIAR